MAAAAPWFIASGGARNVVGIVGDPANGLIQSPQVQWAIGQLASALVARNITPQHFASIPRRAPLLAAVVLRKADSAPAESFEIARSRRFVWVNAADARGMVYALLELADRLKYEGDAVAELRQTTPSSERPFNRIRSLMRLFVSNVEDKPWFNDRGFWRDYLTMAATERFNRFNLTFGLAYDFTSNIRDCYFHFAYPFLLCPPGYDVRAKPLPDAERDSNLQMLRFISEETALRGMQFYLGLWTHAWKWTESPNANYTIQGLDAGNQAAYCRDALRVLLQQCPAISGVTIRTHGESGVAEGNYDFWRAIFEGAAQCGRRVELDLHAKGLDKTMIDSAVATGLPVTISPKFWAEHAGLAYIPSSIRELELPSKTPDSGFFAKSTGSRSFLRYSYGDLLQEGRRYSILLRVWPGTQRLLLSGSAPWAAAASRCGAFCGSDGIEYMEPLSFKGRKGSGLPLGRGAYADSSLRPPGGDWQKYLYTYRLWGRLAYDPGANPGSWRRLLRAQLGAEAAPKAEEALAHASRILPLVTTAHSPSAANNNYWPEMYSNMAIVYDHRPVPFDDTPNPKRFGTVSPLDPHVFSGVDEFAGSLVKGGVTYKYSPLEVAQWLEDLAGAATAQLAEAGARAPQTPDWRRLQPDLAIQCGLGQFFAWKFRAAVLYAVFSQTNHRPALEKALDAYKRARDAWVALANHARGVYVTDITFGYDAHLRGHWSDRLPAIEDDIADMQKRLGDTPPDTAAAPGAVDALAIALAPTTRPVAVVQHAPVAAFYRGRPFVVALSASPVVSTARFWYRRVNQAEGWCVNDMAPSSGRFVASIPAPYTSSPFPLQYHFELRNRAGAAWQYPGLGIRLLDQPYFVARGV